MSAIIGLITFAMAVQCPASAFKLLEHLSSKTPYQYARPFPNSTHALEDLSPGSKPVYLYFVARHGSRWPTLKSMQGIENLAPLLQAAKNKEKHPWTRRWESPFSKDNAGYLDTHGEEEMRALGRRFRDLFPRLLTRPYSPSAYPFISTQVPRASASASAFAQGLFPAVDGLFSAGEDAGKDLGTCSSQPIALTMQPKHADPLLRFYNVCPAYLRYRDALDPLMDVWLKEVRQDLAREVERKLGLPGGSADSKTVLSLWQLCAWEATATGEHSRACSLFDPRAVDLMEYSEDVKHFHAHGHATCVSYDMAVSLGGDLVRRIRQAGSGGDSHNEEVARFHFAHDGTLAGLAAILGLLGSPGLCTPRNASQAIPGLPIERSWWGSTVTPFAANLAVLVYQSPGIGKTRQVRLLWNERTIPIPACGGQLECEAEKFLDFYAPLAEVGKFDDVCNLKEDSKFQNPVQQA